MKLYHSPGACSLSPHTALEQSGLAYEAVAAAAKTRLTSRFQWLDGELAGKQNLMGENFSVADAYLFTVSNWPAHVGIDLAPYANLVAYRARVGSRPAVVTAMQSEGLIK